MSFSAREEFARLLKCEAGGEGEIGMKAVATVVMDRVNVSSGQYLREGQGDLRRIIEAPGEFTCVMSTVYGEVNPQTIWANPPEQMHYDIADWAIGGNRLNAVAETLWY